MLTALDNGRPDRLPCQVHGWMDYYLNHFLEGVMHFDADKSVLFPYNQASRLGWH
jgi:hypothetical protein